jgi:flagellar biosynthesis/type III secretory pathway protein FliH
VTPPADQSAIKRAATPLPLDEALADLRDQIASFQFVLDAPGVEEARTTQQDLLNQLDDYLLPRVLRKDAPLLVVLSGSTGAGKSTLVNTLVGERVSATGVLRPTTSSPILVCHPDDADWWLDERYVLPGFGRVPGPAPDAVVGDQLVIMKSDVLPKGLALLDSPDVDSVFEDHHEFAAQFLAAADIWICVTTAARYADALVWRLLHRARDHGATLGIVLSRVPDGGEEIVGHFTEMLKDNGLEQAAQFVIPETTVSGGMLPSEAADEVQVWLSGISEDEDGRAEVIRSTLGGVLDTFRTRVPELAKRVEEQVALRTMLREEVEAAYATALAELDEATRNGSLLRGEVLARWQDFAGTGDLERALQTRGGQAGHRAGRRRRAPARVRALKTALRGALESVVVAAAERAAEERLAEAQARWERRLASATAAMTAAAARLEEITSPAADELRDSILDAVVALVQELLGREVALAATPGLDALRRALTLVPDDVPVVVRLHPDDLAEVPAEALAATPPSVTVLADPSIERAGAVAQAGARRVDAQLGAALERALAVLRS